MLKRKAERGNRAIARSAGKEPAAHLPPQGPRPDGGGTLCPEFVAHYNALPCITEPLVESNTCSESIGEFCTNEAAFNACRIENTFCDGDTLVSAVNECFALCN